MKLQYELTEDDWVAFNLFHLKDSAAMKSSIRSGTIATTLLPLSIAFVAAINGKVSPLLVMSIGCIGALVGAVMIRRKIPQAIENQARRAVKDSRNQSFFGKHELELEEDWLVERTEVSAHRQAWRAVDRIVESEDYVYFYLSAVSAHILPKRNIPAPELQAFLSRARQLLGNASWVKL